MPIRRDVSDQVQLLPGMLPLGRTGFARHRSQRGWRWAPGDRKAQVLEYAAEDWYCRPKTKGSDPFSNWRGPGPSGVQPWVGNSGWLTSSPWFSVPGNRAYEKFKQLALGDSTQLGTFLAERKEAFGMVANRVTGLYQAYRALRIGDFRSFLRHLSVKPKRKHRSVVRTAAGEASGLWLEYWFGWSPTVNDLYSISEVLAGPPPPGRIHAVSGYPLPLTDSVWTGTSAGRCKWSEEGVYIVKTGATVQVINPDLQLLQQMGLLNPLSVAWEVIPFSFVIDWFTKFGGVISGTSDFVGISLTDAYTTRLVKVKGVYTVNGTGKTDWTYDYVSTRMARSKGLIGPVATLPSFLNYGNSKTRAATAVSLLTQLFLDK